jgi:hypothetical protein
MSTANRSKNLLTHSMVLVGLISLSILAGTGTALPQGNAAYLRKVRTFHLDFANPSPAGLAFSPGANVFLVLKARQTAQPAPDTSDLMMITPLEEQAGSVNVAAAIADSINVAFDSKANRLLLLDAAANELIEVKARPTGYLDPAALTRFGVQPFGLQHPQGMTLDPASGRLFILDSAASRIVRIRPGSDKGFAGEAALREGRVSWVDLRQIGRADLRGIAFNPTNGHLYVLSPSAQTMYELTEAGRVVATRDLAPLVLRNPQGMAFAPSGDLTDAPTQMNLYLADSGLGPALALAPEQGSGRFLELSLTPDTLTVLRK